MLGDQNAKPILCEAFAEFIAAFAFVFIGAGAAAAVEPSAGLSGIAAIAFAHGLTIKAPAENAPFAARRRSGRIMTSVQRKDEDLDIIPEAMEAH